MGIAGHCCFGSGFTLAHFKMDGKICLQDCDKLVGLCSGRFIGHYYRSSYDQLAELESGNEESGRGTEI